ncbi:MAG: hypothetical protein RI988_4029 [Pseudomonadota bacterium]|jgi:hypothetical protein
MRDPLREARTSTETRQAHERVSKGTTGVVHHEVNHEIHDEIPDEIHNEVPNTVHSGVGSGVHSGMHSGMHSDVQRCAAPQSISEQDGPCAYAQARLRFVEASRHYLFEVAMVPSRHMAGADSPATGPWPPMARAYAFRLRGDRRSPAWPAASVRWARG